VTDQLLIDSASRLFADTCAHAVVQDAERDGWAPTVWQSVADAGFPWVSVAESAGGSGGTLTDAATILKIAGAHAAPIPLAETGLLGGWLAAAAGLALPAGPVTVAHHADDTLALSGTTISGRAVRVAWGRRAERLVALVPDGAQWMVASIATNAATVEPDTNLAGEPRDTLVFDRTTADIAPAPAWIDPDALRQRGALTRVLMMAGALDRMSRMTVDYTRQRRQFGRPIAQFQAVQQHLVHAAQDAALVTMAADVAATAAEHGPATFEIAAAKVLAGHAAASATRAAHQAHGAIGMTQEYPLQHLSRRLWSWRHEYGDDTSWGTRLGRASASAGPGALYPSITAGSQVLSI
jgi:acyl-CoA dehydrogenase